MRELAWMALLKYIRLKSARKQPLPDPNGELSPSSGHRYTNLRYLRLVYLWSGIFAANACWRRLTIATELNVSVW